MLNHSTPLVIAILFGSMLAPVTMSTAQTVTARNDAASVSTIHQLFLDDEKEGPHNITEAEHNRRGDARRAQIRALLSQGAILTAEDYHDAAFLFQHGEVADDYMLAHIFAIEAVLRGDASSKWIAASTLDRYLQIIGRPQVFGTQYNRDPKSGMSEQEIDKHPFAGRTQEPFDRALIPAPVRHDLCVPDLTQQAENLKSFNSDKYPDSTLVAPGCTR